MSGQLDKAYNKTLELTYGVEGCESNNIIESYVESEIAPCVENKRNYITMNKLLEACKNLFSHPIKLFTGLTPTLMGDDWNSLGVFSVPPGKHEVRLDVSIRTRASANLKFQFKGSGITLQTQMIVDSVENSESSLVYPLIPTPEINTVEKAAGDAAHYILIATVDNTFETLSVEVEFEVSNFNTSNASQFIQEVVNTSCRIIKYEED